MNRVNSRDEATHDLICPVTGLPVLRRPEWTDVPLGERFRITYSRIGDHILWSQPSGYATVPDFEKAFELIHQVIADAFPDNRKIIELADASNLKGMSLATRREYVRYLKNTPQFVGLVYLGASPVLEMAIRLGIKTKVLKYPVRIARDYAQAIKLSLEMLAQEGLGPSGSEDSVPADQDRPTTIVTRDEWRLDLEGLSAQFRIVDADTIHSVSSGYLTQEHIEPIARLRQEVASSLVSPSKYFIADAKGLTGADRRARKAYLDSVKQWHAGNPLRMYVFCGANWFVRTAARLAAPSLPFRVAMARDWEDAWRIVSADKARMDRDESPQISTMFNNGDGVQGDLERYSRQLLQYIGSINWEVDGIDFNQDIGPDHPFKAVFDALRLIKGELDQLFVEREKSELALRESEQRYRRLVETASEGVVVAQDDHLVYANSATEKISGWSRDELLSRPFIDFVHPEDRDSVAARNIRRMRGEDVPGSNQYRIRSKDGTERWVETSGVLIEWDHLPAVLTLITDITDQKKAEEALKLSEEKFSKAFQQSPVWVVISSLEEGRYVEVNEEFLRNTGFSREEVIGRTSLELETWADPRDRDRIARSIKAEGSVHDVEVRRRTKTGQVLDTLFSSEIVSLGEERFMVSVSQDITDRKQAEKERERLIKELQEALVNVKTLKGLIPICASCKKIRDDQGYWQQVEVYVRQHSGVEFSHGICPDCFRKLYPEYVDEIDFPEEKEGPPIDPSKIA